MFFGEELPSILLRKGTWQVVHLYWLTGHPTPWSHALHSIALGSPWEAGGDWSVTCLSGRDWSGLWKMGRFPTPTDWCGKCEKKPSAQSCPIPQPHSCKTTTSGRFFIYIIFLKLFYVSFADHVWIYLFENTVKIDILSNNITI